MERGADGAGRGLVRLAWIGLGTAIALLLVARVLGKPPAGDTNHGITYRWLNIGGMGIQPSELAKLGLVLVLAQVLGSDRSWQRRLLLALVVAAVPIALVVTEPDLSTAAVLCILTGAMLVLGRIPLPVLGTFALAAAVAAPRALFVLKRRGTGKSCLAFFAEPLDVFRMEHPFTKSFGPHFIKRKSGVLKGAAIGKDRSPGGVEHHNLVCDQIYNSTKLLFVLSEFGLADLVLGSL